MVLVLVALVASLHPYHLDERKDLMHRGSLRCLPMVAMTKKCRLGKAQRAQQFSTILVIWPLVIQPLVISTQGEILCIYALQDSSYRRNDKVDDRNDKVDDRNDISLENKP